MIHVNKSIGRFWSYTDLSAKFYSKQEGWSVLIVIPIGTRVHSRILVGVKSSKSTAWRIWHRSILNFKNVHKRTLKPRIQEKRKIKCHSWCTSKRAVLHPLRVSFQQRGRYEAYYSPPQVKSSADFITHSFFFFVFWYFQKIRHSLRMSEKVYYD